MDQRLGLQRSFDWIYAAAFELNRNDAGEVGLVNDLQHPIVVSIGFIAFGVELQCLGTHGRGKGEALGHTFVAIIATEVVEVRQQPCIGTVDLFHRGQKPIRIL